MKKSLNRSITCENRSKNKWDKIRVSGLVCAHAWTTLRAQARLCARGFPPKNPRTQQRLKTLNLTS